MNFTLRHAIAAILVLLSIAAPVAAGPLEAFHSDAGERVNFGARIIVIEKNTQEMILTLVSTAGERIEYKGNCAAACDDLDHARPDHHESPLAHTANECRDKSNGVGERLRCQLPTLLCNPLGEREA
jgi:hypothetical protein